MIGQFLYGGEARRGPPRHVIEREWRDEWRGPGKAKNKKKKGRKKGKRGRGWRPGG